MIRKTASYLFLTFLTSIAAFSAAVEVYSQQIQYQPDKNESLLWIEGHSNINEFSCTAEEYSGYAVLLDQDQEKSSPPAPAMNHHISLEIKIRVEGFECGRNRMNRDLQDALKAAQHPEIIFIYRNAEIIAAPETPDQPFNIHVSGILHAAGEPREIQFTALGYYLENQRVRAVGSTVIKMTDFNIDPPTALLGLVQANDELTVNFDLTASETIISR